MKTTVTTVNNATENIALAETVMSNTYEICGKRIASVPVSLMEIDYSYQRVTGSTIKKLTSEWDNNKCNFLIASYRNNKFYIIDGQHRMTVAKAKGVSSLPCIIFTGLTVEQEALMFGGQQKNVNKLSTYDTFKANVCCGDETINEIKIDMEVKRICDKYGIDITGAKNIRVGEKALRSLSTARLIVKTSPKLFETIINIINSSNWALSSWAYSDKILCALRTVITDAEDKDKIRLALIQIMNEITATQMISYANRVYPSYPWRAAIALAFKEKISEKLGSDKADEETSEQAEKKNGKKAVGKIVAA